MANNTDLYTTYEPTTACFNQSMCNKSYEIEFEEPKTLDVNVMTVPVNGFVAPFLVFLTIITNTLVCVVLLKGNMRSATNSMLVAMALSDMMTGVFPVPCFIYFFTLGNHKEYVPAEWCYMYDVLTDFVPTIFHTASIWLTVGLAVQRYICVCHNLKAKNLCTIANVVKAVVVVYVIAILTQMTRFFESEFQYVIVQSRINPEVNVTACYSQFIPIVEHNANAYFNIYYWYRIVCAHLIPCISLVILNSVLVQTMHTAQKRRKVLLKQHRNTEGRKIKEANCTTLMLVAVVALFLVVELPSGVLFVIMVMQNTFSLAVISEENTSVTTLIVNLFILLSYPLNFFIYCTMSRQFRETFKRLFIPGSAPLDREHSQYMSLACENGKHKPPSHTKETHM